MTEKPEGESCEKRWESQQQGQHHTQGFVISVEDVGFPLKKNSKVTQIHLCFSPIFQVGCSVENG